MSGLIYLDLYTAILLLLLSKSVTLLLMFLPFKDVNELLHYIVMSYFIIKWISRAILHSCHCVRLINRVLSDCVV